MEAFLIQLVFSITISFLVTFYFVPLCIQLALKLGILDIPGGIKKHDHPTPYLGGVAVYLGFLVSLSLVYPFKNDFLFFLLATTLLLFIGLIDDIVVTKPYQKFFGQCIAALCFLKAGLHLKEPFFLAHYWSIPLSFVWMLVTINAFNLVDIMDGLATSLALYATTTFLIMACLLGQPDVAVLLGAFLGALIAFVWYNKPKAQIYLGDAGSLFIGGFLSTIPFLLSLGIHNTYGFIAPLIVLAVPLAEVANLIIIRSYKGIPFYQGSPDHFALYLKKNGWSVTGILCYVAFLSTYVGAVALLVVLNSINFHQTIFCALLFIGTWYYVLSIKRI